MLGSGCRILEFRGLENSGLGSVGCRQFPIPGLPQAKGQRTGLPYGKAAGIHIPVGGGVRICMDGIPCILGARLPEFLNMAELCDRSMYDSPRGFVPESRGHSLAGCESRGPF